MDDLISRQAAIDAVIEITYDQTALHHGWVDPYYVVNRLEYLPTAEKKGKWVEVYLEDGILASRCTACGDLNTGVPLNYCANCGARMEESDG